MRRFRDRFRVAQPDRAIVERAIVENAISQAKFRGELCVFPDRAYHRSQARRGVQMIIPPSTPMTWPVTYEERSDARNRTTSATSVGSPTRFIRIEATRSA